MIQVMGANHKTKTSNNCVMLNVLCSRVRTYVLCLTSVKSLTVSLETVNIVEC